MRLAARQHFPCVGGPRRPHLKPTKHTARPAVSERWSESSRRAIAVHRARVRTHMRGHRPHARAAVRARTLIAGSARARAGVRAPRACVGGGHGESVAAAPTARARTSRSRAPRGRAREGRPEPFRPTGAITRVGCVPRASHRVRAVSIGGFVRMKRAPRLRLLALVDAGVAEADAVLVHWLGVNQHEPVEAAPNPHGLRSHHDRSRAHDAREPCGGPLTSQAHAERRAHAAEASSASISNVRCGGAPSGSVTWRDCICWGGLCSGKAR